MQRIQKPNQYSLFCSLETYKRFLHPGDRTTEGTAMCSDEMQKPERWLPFALALGNKVKPQEL